MATQSVANAIYPFDRAGSVKTGIKRAVSTHWTLIVRSADMAISIKIKRNRS
jgi:hypothetical protein